MVRQVFNELRILQCVSLFEGFLHQMDGSSKLILQPFFVGLAAGCHIVFGLLSGDPEVVRLDSRLSLLSKLRDLMVVLEVGLIE